MELEISKTTQKETLDSLQSRFFMEKENRSMVTPYAFGVHDHLLGCPLATPWQRLKALCLDLLVIALLTGLSLSFQFLIVAFLLWRLSLMSQLEWFSGKPVYQHKFWLRFVAFILLIAGLALMFEGNDGQSIWRFFQLPLVDNIKNTGFIKFALNFEGEYFSLSMVYLVVLPTIWHGQTLGKRMMSIQTLRLDNKPLTLWGSLERYGGYAAGVATGFTGFAQLFWDHNRQAIQDKISHTVVVKKITNRR